MKLRRIRCGSRSVTITHKTGLLAWMRVDDLGSECHFAMDMRCIDKVIDALAQAKRSLRKAGANR